MLRILVILLVWLYLGGQSAHALELERGYQFCRNILQADVPAKAFDLLFPIAQLENPYLDRNGRPVGPKERALAAMALKLREALRIGKEHEETASLTSDPELQREAHEEMARLQAQIQAIAPALRAELVRYLEGDIAKQTFILEVRNDGGGQDTERWVQNLAALYSRQGKSRENFKVTPLGGEYTEHGAKVVRFEIQGADAYHFFHNEVGRHRFEFQNAQQGKTYSNNIIVSLLPSPTKVQIDAIPASDIALEFTTAQGPGGQNVNKVASAVRLTHIPTGITVKMQESRDQGVNRQKAMIILAARVQEEKAREAKTDARRQRLNQVGIGNWRDLPRVRTYDFKDKRVIDYRTKQEQPLLGDFDRLSLDTFQKELDKLYLENLLGSLP